MKLVRCRMSGDAIQDSCAVAIGNFDGLHKGHQLLINTMREQAAPVLQRYLLSFEPQPAVVLGKPVIRVMSVADKIRILTDYGVDGLCLLRFNHALMALSPQEFVRIYLRDKLNVKQVFVGSEFRFGHRRQGDANLLVTLGKSYGFDVHIIEPMSAGKTAQKIGSSALRIALQQGDFAGFETMTDRPYEFSARVGVGQRLGAQLGFPTANCLIKEPDSFPLSGVYGAKVQIGSTWYTSAMNVGYKPSVNAIKKKTIECHLLDFNRDIYGQRIIVRPFVKIRDEKKFEDLYALKKQIQQDIHKISTLTSQVFDNA